MVRRRLFSSAGQRGPAPHALLRDESGASALVIGLSMTAMLGAAGMAVDAGVWYADRRNVEGAADAAAFSAAKDLYDGDSVTNAKANAKAVTAQYGYTDGSGGVTVTVNNPPASGPNAANSSAVEVIVHKPESLMFASFILHSASVAARAVATSGSAGSSGAGYCVLALDTATSTTVDTSDFDLSNGASVDLSQCGAYVNASGSDAVVVSGGAKLNAANLSIVGTYQQNNGGKINVTGKLTTGAPVMTDPYASVATPAPSSCTYNNSVISSSSSGSISPGTYCNGLQIGNGASVTMSPGVYIIDRGAFSVQGGAKLDASSGVTIVLTSSTGSNYATINIANGANITVTAPSSGATGGLAIMQDRKTPYATATMAGGAKMNITGAMYFPSQLVTWANGSTNNSTCTQLIAFRISYAGGSKFGNSCSGVGVTAIGSTAATATALVE